MFHLIRSLNRTYEVLKVSRSIIVAVLVEALNRTYEVLKATSSNQMRTPCASLNRTYEVLKGGPGQPENRYGISSESHL